MKKVIVLGVGNLLLKDEGVGVQAVQRLSEEITHPEVEFIDGGTSGLDLLPLFERCCYLLILDCVRGGEKPGTIYKFDVSEIEEKTAGFKISAHDFDLVDTILMARALQKELPEIIIYGVEPESIEWGLELTPTVAGILEKLVAKVKKDINELLKRG